MTGSVVAREILGVVKVAGTGEVKVVVKDQMMTSRSSTPPSQMSSRLLLVGHMVAIPGAQSFRSAEGRPMLLPRVLCRKLRQFSLSLVQLVHLPADLPQSTVSSRSSQSNHSSRRPTPARRLHRHPLRRPQAQTMLPRAQLPAETLFLRAVRTTSSRQ